MTKRNAALRKKMEISIHIPRVGDDGVGGNRNVAGTLFQSTSPVWGMTTPQEERDAFDAISIHIPRVGDDVFCIR